MFMLSIINWLENHQLPCIFKKLIHFDCPGCGFQRSIIALLKGNFGESFKLYPPLVPILLLFSLLATYLILKWKNGYIHLKYMYITCTVFIIVNYFYKLIYILN
jgi:hypothetical protein